MGATKWWNRRGRADWSGRPVVPSFAGPGPRRHRRRAGRGGRVRVVVLVRLHHDHGVDRGILNLIPSPVQFASTSTRGISGNTINVVFPVVALNSLAGQEGFASDAEYGEQTKAINFYVPGQQGGRDQRSQDRPDHRHLRSDQRTQMRALCKTWTEGSPAAFAVLDGVGDWTATTSCASPRRATPRSSAPGRR